MEVVTLIWNKSQYSLTKVNNLPRHNFYHAGDRQIRKLIQGQTY